MQLDGRVQCNAGRPLPRMFLCEMSRAELPNALSMPGALLTGGCADRYSDRPDVDWQAILIQLHAASKMCAG
ncbi:hypothetical protein ABH945_006571 [Paraburkholderia sp. GAS333]|uniref:hypothetical protein n=1 Tax=Paraburkholderia sp. GAS333 TaxID=3156279 RepID=UPI003D1E4516